MSKKLSIVCMLLNRSIFFLAVTQQQEQQQFPYCLFPTMSV